MLYAHLNILLIEDNPGDARLTREYLAEAGGTCGRVYCASSLSDGLEHLGRESIDVLLLDLTLPDSEGLDGFLRVQAKMPTLPVVLLTALDDEMLALEAVRLGAQDYLVKGRFDGNLLLRTIHYAVERMRIQAARMACEERFRTLIEENTDGMLVIDGAGIIVLANPAAEAMLNRAAGTLVGTTFGLPVVAGDTAELDLIGKNGELATGEMRVMGVEYDGQRCHVISIRDISARKEHEEALKKAVLGMKEALAGLESSKVIIEAQNRQLMELSLHDPLTGLYNRRHMVKILDQEYERSERYRHDLSCLLMDLDFFKIVNDTHGHDFGDIILKEFAAHLITHTRDSDLVFRYGGEEFMVLLPHTDLDGAQFAAEKIRRVCEQQTYGEGIHAATVTVSIGVSSLRHSRPRYAHELISFADKALYEAKAEGRNRVKVYRRSASDRLEVAGGEYFAKVGYVQKQLASIMERTRKSALASIDLLTRSMGNCHYNEQNQHLLNYLGLLSKRLHLPSTMSHTLNRAAMLHDCFKVCLSGSLLDKREALDNDERERILSQPDMSVELLESFDFFANERIVLQYHHENFDGSGYPQGLKAEQIPIGARIFAIADAVVAMESDRPYRARLSRERLIQELRNNAGTQFDPALVALFLEILEDDRELSATPLCNGP